MQNVSLEFQGTGNVPMLLGLLAAVAAVMVGWAVWQLLRRRLRAGLLCLASAAGPVAALPALIADASAGFARGQSRRGRSSILAAVAVGLLPVAVALTLAALTVAGLLGQGLGAGAIPAALAAAGRALLRVGPGLWLLLLGVQVALAAGVFYASVYSHLGAARMARLLALRVGAILVLLLILFKPAVAVTLGEDADKPYLFLLADRSRSMGVIDQPDQPSRYEQVMRKLRQQEPRLRRHFRVLYRHFGETDLAAETLTQLTDLTPDGYGAGATNLVGPLRNAAAAHPAASMAAAVVFSDGGDNVNAPSALAAAASESVVPIHAVGVGSTVENPAAGPRGVHITAVEAPLEAIVRNTTHLQVRLNVAGLPRSALKVSLLDEAGAVLHAEQVFADQAAAQLSVRLPWTPKTPAGAAGDAVQRLRVRAEPASGAAPDDLAARDEAEIHLLLTQPRIRVVYIEGSIRPEYKFLHRMLASDPNVQFHGLIRVTGSRFWAQGAIDGRKLEGFPTTDADFELFDVLILGDLDSSYLTRTQMARIRAFVQDGGALLMLGGSNSFGPGGYGGTDLETVLPVVMGQRGQGRETTPLIPQLTPLGEKHPVFEGIGGYFIGPSGAKPQAETPLRELTGCVSTVRAKPGTALAVHPSRRNEDGPLTVLAVQQVGSGRAAAFTADTTWQWYLPMRGLGADSPYDRFWGQLVRWLAGVESKSRDARASVLGRLGPTRSTVKVGQTLELTARVQDGDGNRPEDAVVTAVLEPVDGSSQRQVTLPLAWQGETRTWQATYAPAAEGIYRVRFSARRGEVDLGNDALTINVQPHSAEMESTARRQAVLDDIAARSGGRAVELAGFDDLVDHLITLQQGRAPAGPETRTSRLYHFAGLFILFCGLLTGEWLLRRRWQLQ